MFNLRKKKQFRAILIACGAVIISVLGLCGPSCVTRSVSGAVVAYQMPWRPGPAWPSSIRDADMVRAFWRECGILYTV